MKSTWRKSTAYPCATYGCHQQGAWVETREVQPNGMPTSLGFYGYCEDCMGNSRKDER